MSRIQRSRQGVARLVASAFFALALLSGNAAQAAPSDVWITLKAKLKLFTTPGVSAAAVDVDTVDGVVSLFGTVESTAAKGKADQVVRDVGGVRIVRNYLQVSPTPTTEEDSQ